MSTSLIRPFGVPNPARVSEVERVSLAGQLREELLRLSFGSTNPRIQNIRKDVYRGQNKAPDTIASMLTDAFNSGRENPARFATAVWDFFSARVNRLKRSMKQLSPIETKEEGELNLIQVAIDQGDTSTPTLKKFVGEIDEYVAVLMEMRAAAVAELYRAERSA